MSVLALLLLELPTEAKRQEPIKMMKIGEETFTLETGETFVKAQEFLSKQQFEKASALLKQFLVNYPNSIAGHYKYAYALLQQEKFSEALEQAKLCTELKPTFFGGWALLGEASMKLKLDAQAKAAYQKALEIQPTGENADIIREHLADMTSQNEAVVAEAATAAANKQIEEQNRSIMKMNQALALCDKANEFSKQKQFEPGLSVCREALKAAPDSDQVKENVVGFLNNYAADCVQKQNLKQAEDLLKEALALQSKSGISTQLQMTTLRNYSNLLNFAGRKDEAKQIDQQMNTLSSSNAR